MAKKDDKKGSKNEQNNIKNLKNLQSKAKAAKDAKAANPGEELTIDQKKQQLIDKAKKDGRLDQRAVFAVIPETVENAEVLDALYTELADLNIEITATDPDTTKFTDEWDEE